MLICLIAGWIGLILAGMLLFQYKTGAEQNEDGLMYMVVAIFGLGGLLLACIPTSEWFVWPTIHFLQDHPVGKKIAKSLHAVFGLLLQVLDGLFYVAFLFFLAGFVVGLMAAGEAGASEWLTVTAFVCVYLACLMRAAARLVFLVWVPFYVSGQSSLLAAWSGVYDQTNLWLEAIASVVPDVIMNALPHGFIIILAMTALATVLSSRTEVYRYFNPLTGLNMLGTQVVTNSAMFGSIMGNLIGFFIFCAVVYFALDYIVWVLAGLFLFILEIIVDRFFRKTPLLSTWLMKHGWLPALAMLGLYALAYFNGS